MFKDIEVTKIFGTKLSLTCFVIICLIIGCKPTLKIGKAIKAHNLIDGIYEGNYKGGPNYSEVRITIKNQKIVDIEILKHNAWKGKKAESIIPQKIIDEQSTDVDAVSGATNSSHVIINAVQKAIENAYIKNNKF